MNKIRDYRVRKELTQEELAQRLGVSQSAVANWERGVAYPTVQNLLTMSEILECSPNDLLGIKVG